MKKLLLLSIIFSGYASSQEYEFNIPMQDKPHKVIKFSAESGKTYNWDRCFGQTTQALSEDGVACEKVINSRSGFTGSVDVCVSATKDYLTDPYCFSMCQVESVTWGNCTASVTLSEHLDIKNITNTDNRYVGTAEMLCTDGNWSIRSSSCEDNFASCGTDHNSVNNNPTNLCQIGASSSVTANINTMNWNCTTSANSVACLSYKVSVCDNNTFNGCIVGTSGGYTSAIGDTTATWTCSNGSSSANCSKAKTLVAGVCGSSNGQTLSNLPSTNLCTTGTASVVSNGTNNYTWSCSGSANTETTSAGETVNCSAIKTAVCDNNTFGGCTQGTSAYTSAIGAAMVTWNCTSGSSSGSCSKAATNGEKGTCGSSNGTVSATIPTTNLCTSGTQTNIINGWDAYTWFCMGSEATQTSTIGLNDSCSTTKTAVCDNSNFQGCTLGTASAYTSTLSATTATWNCVNGSSTVSCSKSKSSGTSGSCGSANGQTFSSAPANNLCSSGGTGTSMTVNSTSYDWICYGSNATHTKRKGNDDYCSAIKNTCNDSANDTYGGWVAHNWGGADYQDGCHANSTSSYTCPAGVSKSCIDVRDNGDFNGHTFQERVITCRACP